MMRDWKFVLTDPSEETPETREWLDRVADLVERTMQEKAFNVVAYGVDITELRHP